MDGKDPRVAVVMITHNRRDAEQFTPKARFGDGAIQ
jgi:hypothetical protein